MKNILLIEPKYYTKFPPLGLLKIGAYHKKLGNNVQYIRGQGEILFKPDEIYITSLFTYSWKSVKKAYDFYRFLCPKTPIHMGGIYISIFSQLNDQTKEHIKFNYPDAIIHSGILPEVEDLLPDWDDDYVKNWNKSILFSSRGCIRKCPFCAVPLIEGSLKSKIRIDHLIHPKHKEIIFWDNNILASPHWEDIYEYLLKTKKYVDFNQGIDARLINSKVANQLSKLKTKMIRIAYDHISYKPIIYKAVNFMKEAGINGRKILVYLLYNFNDTPEDFLERLKDLMELGVVAYPMRYEPLDALEKNKFISENWNKEYLDAIPRARRVIGYSGAFVPHEGMKKKILNASSFYNAFEEFMTYVKK
ncbi:hypothetical protein X275_01080 [Marinitoga sp. 1197]|uniref:B12-binding domain-containing radical SAM protein n=1 Tax=Marinitoga sp. 1197 TaxID=1428449 RepID=UPI0006413E6F|nr:radical SAM protein [Marinitoga sp. 1197]AJW76943.1 hypothetical protein UF08_54 [Marinitoga camini virus 1]KLO24022.1 hypothetical protein X275_01080 [Marinitoga sp. 1197]